MAELGTHCEIEDLGGGRFRNNHYLKPIAYWKPGIGPRRITNMLVNTGDPNFPIGADELVQCRFDPRIAGKSPLWYFGRGQSRVTMGLLGANNVSGTVSGNSVRFPNAWNNADLTMTLGGHILKEGVLFRTGHPDCFTFRIDEHVGFDPTTLIFGNDFRILQPSLHPPAGSAMMDVPLTWQVSQSGGKWLLTVVLPVGDWAGWTLDPTLTLQPDAADGLDVYIGSDLDDRNCGALNFFTIGELNTAASINRTLIKFNLSSLLSNAIINSTTLSLYAIVDRSSNAATYLVYRQKRAWVEGTGAGTLSGDGATWTQYDQANSLAWQAAGGFGADDCEQTAIGSRAFTATEILNEFKNFSLTPTTKAALDLGNGWLIKADTELENAYAFASSDHTTAANRPKLVIDYQLPAAGAIFNVPFSAPFRGPFG